MALFDACYRKDNGLVVDVRATGSVWSSVEQGHAPGPYGLLYGIVTVDLPYTPEEIELYKRRYVYEVNDKTSPTGYATYDRENCDHTSIILLLEKVGT